MRTFELPDQRSLEVLIGEADAWEKVFDLCKELALPNFGGSGLEYVLTAIRELHTTKMRYEKLVVELKRIMDDE